jgi:large subunit ribosomal protein L10
LLEKSKSKPRIEGMKKDEKEKKAQELHKDLEKSRGVIFSGFEGITVAQDTELRRNLAQAGSTYRVVKNTLIERAAQGTSAAPAAQKLRGTTSLAYTECDPVALAKAISAYAKDHPVLVFKAGVVEGRVVSMTDLASIASLPSREALLAKVLYLINASAQRTASSIAGVARNLAGVIQHGVTENKFQ